MIFNFSKNDYDIIKKLFLSKDYQRITTDFNLDNKIDDKNIQRNLLIIKSFLHIGNIQRASELLLKVDDLFNFHEVKFLLGTYFQNKNNLSEALNYFQKAIELNSQSPDYYNEAGNVSGDMGRFDLAIEYYQQALNFKLHPSIQSILYSNIGNAYYNNGNPDQGIEFSKKSIDLNQSNYPAWTNLGLCLFTKKKYEESINIFKEVLKLNPNFEEAINNLSVIYIEMDNYSLAKDYLNKLLSINPKNHVAYLNLGKCYSSLREHSFALNSYKKAFELNKNNLTAVSNYLFELNYSDKISQQEIVDEHNLLSTFFIQDSQQTTAYQNINNSKIKIAYVSADFKNHSVMSFFSPVVKGFNKDKFELYCLYNGTEYDKSTQLVKDNSIFIDISKKNDEEVIQFLKQQNIDILIDLSGHTKGNRLSLFAQKPCQVQINWIGYPNTTGLKQMDYRIVDNYTDPLELEVNNLPEKLIRMSNFFMTFDEIEPYEIMPAPSNQKNYITFGSFNNSNKLSNLTIQIWSNILTKDHQNKLILKNYQFNDPNIKNKIKMEFLDLGVKEDQLIFYGKMPRDEHFNLYNQIDIALDPTPYNGTTTSMESLWMGVPVITLEGTSHHSRVTHSILMNMQLNELSANSKSEYINIAIDLANDRQRIQTYKQKIRQRLLNSPIMNHKNFIQELEQVLENLINK